MIKSSCILLSLFSMFLLSGCAKRAYVFMNTKVDGKYSSFTIHKTLAQKEEVADYPDTLFHAFDTAYFFFIPKKMPARLIDPTATAEPLVTKTLRFALAKKNNDLYFWGDQNFNGTFADDHSIVRKHFFLDTVHHWLGQFDDKIDYSFTIPHTSDASKNIHLPLEVDVYKRQKGEQSSYLLEILYNSKNSYQIATLRAGWKRYVAVGENLPNARFWGMNDGKIYFFSKKNVGRENKIDYAKGYMVGDTIRFGKKDWRIAFQSFRGDTLQLTQTPVRKSIISWNEGGKVSPFEGRDLMADTLIASTALLQKENTLLVFWAFWCGPCRHNIPAYNELFDAIDKTSTSMLGIIIDDAKFIDTTRKDINSFNVQWPNILSELRSGSITGIAKTLRVETIPTYVIVNNEGTILYRGDDLAQVKKVLLK